MEKFTSSQTDEFNISTAIFSSSVCYCIIDDFLKDEREYAGRWQRISSAYLSSADPSHPPVSLFLFPHKREKSLQEITMTRTKY